MSPSGEDGDPERHRGAKGLSSSVRRDVQVSCFFQICSGLAVFADTPADSVVTIGIAMVIPSFRQFAGRRGIQISWWSYRGGHTRSHPEHGS